MTLDSSGNLGIGTSASGYTLHVSNAAPSVRISNTSEAAAQTQTLVFGTTIYNRATIQSVNVGTSGADLTFLTAPAAGSTLERARIDSSGNLGIGTTSPYKSLTVGATDAAAWITAGGPNTNLTISSVGANGSVLFRTGGTISDPSTTTERARIDASGNLGVGTTSPASRLDLGSSYVNPATDTAADVKLSVTTISATEKYGFYVDSTASLVSLAGSNSGGGIFRWVSGSTERARIDSSGNLHVGETAHTDGSMFYNAANSTLNAWRGSTTASDGLYGIYSNIGGTKTVRGYFRCDGGLANYSANNVNLSDERLKKDIQPAGNYLSKICAIEVKNFRYKTQDELEDITLGVIAQDVEAVAPELVSNDGFGETPDDGIPLKAIYQTDLQYALMKCIQEQQAIITALTTRITALEAK
jgi:hypothetical protein